MTYFTAVVTMNVILCPSSYRSMRHGSPSTRGRPKPSTTTRAGSARVRGLAAPVPARMSPPVYGIGMEAIVPWLTPALVVALGAWLRADLRDLRREMRHELGALRTGLAALEQRVSALAERVAHLEGALLRTPATAADDPGVR